MLAEQLRRPPVAVLLLLVIAVVARLLVPETHAEHWTVGYSATMRVERGIHIVTWAPGRGVPEATCVLTQAWTTCGAEGDIPADSITSNVAHAYVWDGDGRVGIEIADLRESIDFHQR